MQITLSKYAGFCDGVERAYEIVRQIAKDKRVKKPIFVLGSLVHNQDVVKSIERLGIKKIHVDGYLFKHLDAAKNKIGTIVITAHGMGPKIYDYAKKKKIDLIDTTCPRVIKAQRLAKVFLDRAYQIIIIGEKEHKEVKGIAEWARKKVIFVETEKDLQKLKLKAKQKIAVISQTTQNQVFVKKSWEFIRKKYKNAEIADTICLTTQNRQDEVREKAKNSKAVVVIGSPESANSNRLWEIAREINPKSYFIERASQVKKAWFAPFKKDQKVWVTAGASTPKWIIDGVIQKLKKF